MRIKLGHRGSNFVFILPYIVHLLAQLLTTVLSGTNEHLEIFTTNAPCLKSFTIEIQGRIEFAENTLLREKKAPSQNRFAPLAIWFYRVFGTKQAIYMERKKFRMYVYKFTSFCGGKKIFTIWKSDRRKIQF